ncbi:hypothetical protein [Stenotrophomonas maltophilia]|uniref:Transmembrane protein n=1 Tax=Stenotrophomonas maltophilia TaxID=40324 RepID=A0A4S2D683_STEMA|nr:hypothetical protein [Stenotrophomonas maltophilia]TGY35924.1 hypothetical protein E5352_04755 [Stenotrophomonas maltophilia]
MNDIAQRRTYAVVALLLGLPTLAVGGTLSVLAFIVFFSRNSYMGTLESLALLAWGLSGILGLLGWLWLSGVYLRHGREGLRRSSPLGWIGIACGVIGALSVLVVVMRLLPQGGWEVLGYLTAGPPLLVPSAQLAWMRWSGQTQA